MNAPNERLMSHYGTRDVFIAKTAGDALIARLIAALLAGGLVHEMQSEDKTVAKKLSDKDSAEHEAATARMDQANSALRHTDVPLLIPAGYDQGMVRTAMVAVAAGEDLAKMAGMGNFISGVLPAIKTFGQKAGGLLAKAPAAAGGAAEKTMASAAQEAPGLLGKAKSKLMGPLGWKGNAALIGGTIGAGYLLNKGTHAAAGAMGRESAGSPVYGSGARGYNPPLTVNEWGTPQ